MVKVIAGLGNPGRAYEGTRHNVGFDVVLLLAKASAKGTDGRLRGGEDDLAWVRVRLPVHASVPVPPKPEPGDEAGLEAWRAAKKAARHATREEDVLLATPLAFMNRSGPPIRALLEEHGSRAEEDLLVVVDDVDLEAGRLRLRREGSSGGHRGLESIEEALGTQRWSRLRLGVGRNPPGVPSEDWVLARPAPEAGRELARGVERAASGVKIWLARGPERAMDEINRKQDETKTGDDNDG